MSRSTTMLIALAVVVSAVLSSGALAWDLSADYGTVNPNGQWTYGYVDGAAGVGKASSPLSSYTFTAMTATWFWPNNILQWKRSDTAGDWCVIRKNVSAGDIGFFSIAPIPYNTVQFHPGSGTVGPAATVARWTAVVGGSYNVSTMFSIANVRTDSQGGVGVHVIKNGSASASYVWDNAVLNPDNTSKSFSGVVTLAAGDTLDFAIDDYNGDAGYDCTNVSATITEAATLGTITGNVTAGGSPLAGVTMTLSGWPTTTTTDSAGNYSFTVPANTYTLSADKAGYITQTTSSFVLAVGATVTRNLVMSLIPTYVISGTVTANAAASIPLVGATVTVPGGVSTTTDSAGYYSVQVLQGVYDLVYHKTGYSAKRITVDASASNQTRNIQLDLGWDVVDDYTSATAVRPNPELAAGNPALGSPWTYGYQDGATGVFTPFELNRTNPISGCAWNRWLNQLASYDVPNVPGAGVNFDWTNAFQVNASGLGLLYMEPRGFVWNGPAHATLTNRIAIVRFVSPVSGFFDITAKFGGASTDGATRQIGIKHIPGGEGDGYWMFGDESGTAVKTISGFAGRAVNGYADSNGTSPVLTYETSNMPVMRGDIIDLVQWYGTGFVSADVTLTPVGTTLSGKVTASGVAVAYTKVTAVSNDFSYECSTDASGNYVVVVGPGTYTMSVESPYLTDPATQTVTVQDGVPAIKNITVKHSGNWDATDDFSVMSNPAGQWSYGCVNGTDYTQFTAHTQLSMLMPPYQTFTIPNGIVLWGSYSSKGLAMDLNPWSGWIGKNVSNRPIDLTILSTVNHILPGELFIAAGGDGSAVPALRWTAPDTRAIKLKMTVKNQCATVLGETDMKDVMASVTKNGTVMSTRIATGFKGRASAGYTDSIGPYAEATYEAILPVAAGDKVDFVAGPMTYPWGNDYPMKSMAIWADIETVTGIATVTSVSQIKNLAVGTQFFMTGPVKLVCPTKNDNAFNKEWNAPTVPVNYFFVENADRTQGLKIVVSDGVVPLYSTGTTVTFSGVVATDATGQKVAQLIAFLSAVPGTGPAPIGKTSKGLAAANNGTLVKVWGKIVSKTINTLVPPETWTFGDPPQTCNLWDYEYITINDGGGDIKIPTHTQFNAMSNYDPLMSGLQVGDYVSVVGVQTTTNGSDVVVMPRNHFDILNFTDLP